jgi:Tol biopolymer transport system component
LYTSANLKTKYDVWVLSLEDRKSTPLLRTEFDEAEARFSPDGRWFAYTSNETGRNEVWVRPFVPSSSGEAGAPEGKWMVSKNGGSIPAWQPDGKGLAYVSADGKLMAVEVAASTFIQSSTPEPLFQIPRGVSVGDRAADGRVLLAVPIEQSVQTPFTVVLNWQAGLKK